MASKFLTSKDRAEKGRAMRRPNAKSLQQVQAVVESVLKADTVMQTGKARVNEYLDPLLFAITAQRESDGVELGMAGSLRICITGCREVLCAPYETIQNFLTSLHGQTTPKAVLEFLCKSTLATLTSFVTSNPGMLLKFSCSSFEGIYLPPAWVYHERIGMQDVLGIRIGFLPCSSEQVNWGETLHRVNTFVNAAGKPSSSLQAVVDFYAMAE